MKNALNNARLDQDHSSTLAFVVLTAAVWLYLILRAVYIPLIHDEAATFEAYMMFGTFLPPDAYWDANNHLLNSIVGAFSYKAFGFSYLSIRLLGILSFPVYALFTYRLGKVSCESSISRWLFYLGMICTPFAIEFFGLARGYGAALGFFTGYIYFIFRLFYSPESSSYYLKLVLFGFLTVAANFSFFSGVFILAFLLFTKWVLYQELPFKFILYRGLTFAVVVMPWIWWILELKSRGLLYYGGDAIIPFFFEPMEQMYLRSNSFSGIISLPFLLATIVVLQRTVSKKLNFLADATHLYSTALILALGWIVLLQLLLGVNYPEDRAALYFFPLIVGSLSEKIPGLTIKNIPLQALFLLWPVIDLGSSLNLTHSRLWYKEHIPEHFYTRIQEAHTGETPPTISGYKLRESNWPFGIFNSASPLVISASGFPNTSADFILASNRWKNDLPVYGFDTLAKDEASKQFVLMRETTQAYNAIADTSFTLQPTDAEFINLIELLNQDVPSEALRLSVTLEAPAEETILPITLIASAFNDDGSTLYYEVLIGTHLGDTWGEMGEVTLAQVLPAIPESSSRLVIYLYNPGRKNYSLKQVNAAIESIHSPPAETEN